jgi:bifunctional UDP-N-acetylglucosamine pyrophosphorylase/glucosamine-1-phosphate N-acetyltransferase
MALKVVILAAGKGTRMRSARPKVLQTLGPCSLLEHVIRVAMELGCGRPIVVYGHGGELVRDELAHLDTDWVEQAQQLGTGHAVQQALPLLGDGDRVLVLYGDVPLVTAATLRPVIDAVGPDLGLGLLTILLDQPTGFGRIVRQDGEIKRIVEEKDADDAERRINEVNSGIMAIEIRKLRGWLARLGNDNAQGEYYLTDIIALATDDGVPVHGIIASDSWEVMGINDRTQQAQLERVYQQRQAQRLMAEGLSLRDPARFDLRGELSIGSDVEFDINVLIEGRVSLGDRVKVGANVIIKDAIIGNDVEILPNSLIDSSTVGDEAVIGPFARLRPDTELGPRVKVGNFVEIKKSQIDEGAKVNHLSYIGDASIGKAVNIGAGTITCNYDGANKHRTIIGDHAFIGSDSQLVAPVEIGAGATIGAGSTITRHAIAGELTLSRSKQMTRPGWKRPTKA